MIFNALVKEKLIKATDRIVEKAKELKEMLKDSELPEQVNVDRKMIRIKVIELENLVWYLESIFVESQQMRDQPRPESACSGA